MPLFGPPNVEKLKEKKDVKGLINALGYGKDYKVRSAAAQALGEIRDHHAVEPLITALKDKNNDVCTDAARALGEIGDPRAEDGLIAAINSISRYTRTAAVEALGRIGDLRAVEPLVTTLGDVAGNVRDAAAKALGNLGWKPSSDEKGAQYHIARREWNICVDLGQAAVLPLVAALKDKDLQQDAEEALGQIGQPAVQSLVAACKDNDWELRKAAVQTLGRIRCHEAVFQLSFRLKDKELPVRLAAVQALGHLSHKDAVEPLLKKLQDKDLSEAAAQALVQIGAPAVKPLFNFIEQKELREPITQILLQIRDPLAVDAFIPELQSDSSICRKVASQALKNLGWKPEKDALGAWNSVANNQWETAAELGSLAVEPLIASLKDEDEQGCQAATSALAKIGTPAVESLITAILSGDPGDKAVHYAAQALGCIGGAGTIEPLIVALRDNQLSKTAVSALETIGWEPGNGEDGAWYYIRKGDWKNAARLGAAAIGPLIDMLQVAEVNKDAAQTLGAIGDPRAVHPLIAVLAERQSWPPTGWEPAVQALSQIGEPAVEPLIAVIQDKSNEACRGAIETLGRIGDARAVEPLIAVIQDENNTAHREAVQTLGKIGDARVVKPLIAGLMSSERSKREYFAEALVAIYQSGRLNKEHQQLILAQRSTITQTHHDVKNHTDDGVCVETHSDNWTHFDRGIGFFFPM